MNRIVIVASLLLAVSSAAVRAQDTTRLSVDSAGGEGDDASFVSKRCVADNGKTTLVVFASRSTNLVKSDKNGKTDVFLRDVAAATTTRIVLDTGGNDPDDDSSNASITPDGRFVVFQSNATDLVSGDKNGATDVFVLDRASGVIERISVEGKGNEGDGDSDDASISDDGRFVVFSSRADNLVKGDSNAREDVFLRDRKNLTTTCVSLNQSGSPGDDVSREPEISGDASTIVFGSLADDLVTNDTNLSHDVFLYDVATKALTLGDVNESGFQLRTGADEPTLTPDGKLLAFRSTADNVHRAATSGVAQIYVRDPASGQIWLASHANDGAAADNHCEQPSLFTRTNGAGTRPQVAFWSEAQNLPDADSAFDFDAYVFDVPSGAIQCANVDSTGVGGGSGGNTSGFGTTPDGSQIVFSTRDGGLVAGDTNGDIDVFERGLQWTSFTEFGTGLAGTGGYVPHLSGIGGWCEAGIWEVDIADGLGRANGHLWVGLGRTNGINLFGGTFYVDFSQPIFPIPIRLFGAAGVGGAGSLTIPGINVENLGEISIFLQATLIDAHAIKGVSMTNALELEVDAG
jgi:Tol biopolymer transport system component